MTTICTEIKVKQHAYVNIITHICVCLYVCLLTATLTSPYVGKEVNKELLDCVYAAYAAYDSIETSRNMHIFIMPTITTICTCHNNITIYLSHIVAQSRQLMKTLYATQLRVNLW